MQSWLRAFHGSNSAFPATVVAVKAAVTVALGLLVGFEREWSNKDIGVRTFTMTALLGLLGSMLGTPVLMLTGASVLALIGFANLRSLQVARKLEATTSAALMIIFLLGVLVGQGHLFTPVACAILVAMLLSLKPQFRAFAGGLTQREVRSAIVLGLLGFVVWPLLPGRYIDPWQLLQPREAWFTVLVIACLGFVNYVLLRVFGEKGIYLTAALGGLVNSTASVAELSSTLPAAGMASLTVPVVLLTSLAMYARNLLILAIFAPAAIRVATGPLAAMAAVAGWWIYRGRRRAEEFKGERSLELDSPVSLKKILKFGLLFLAVQALATVGQRMLGSAGFQAVNVLGGLVSSASTTAASANLAMHGRVTAAQAGMAAVLTSLASAFVNVPIVHRQAKDGVVSRELMVSTALQLVVGVAVLWVQGRWLH